MTTIGAPTFSDHALAAMLAGEQARVRYGQPALEAEHILAGLLEVGEGNARLMLGYLRIGPDELRRELDLFLRRSVALPTGDSLPLDGRDVPLGAAAALVLARAAALAGGGPLGTEDLLSALLVVPSPAATLLRTFGITPEELGRRFSPERGGEPGEHGPVDLVEVARRDRLPPLVARPALLRELGVRLLAGERRAVVLTGEPGSGRTSLALLLARALAAESGAAPLPPRLVRPGDAAILRNPAQAIADAARLAAARVPDAAVRPPNTKSPTSDTRPQAAGFLWLPNLHTYFGASARPADLEAGNVLRDVISKGEVRVIGSTTPDAQRRHLADAALYDALTVGEPSADEVAAIVAAVAPGLGAAHGVAVADDARAAAVSLARRYGSFTGVALPGSALRVLERACVEVRLAGASALGFEAPAGDRTVDAADVAVAVSALTGIAAQQLSEADAARLAAMEEHLRQRVIGQDEALNALARAVRRARLGFKDPKRPVGSFMFLGGSGVGKTESARALAEFLFGSEEQMIRLDMSEYAEKHTVARMIGAPPGYVGYEEGGQLTEAVRRRPESVVLFDEVEKAHPDVLTIMLQILEDGRLTDGKGRTVDFRQAVIILTSNVGTQLLRTFAQAAGRPDTADSTATEAEAAADAEAEDGMNAALKAALEEELRRYFRVEFLNRLDKIIYFRFLAPDDLARILDLMLAKAAKRAAESGVSFEVTPAAKAWLLDQNDEPEFGARPLRRIVQDQIEDALVDRLLRGEVARGGHVRIDREADTLTFTTPTPEAAA